MRRTLDLVDGATKEDTVGLGADGQMLNYLQDASVRSGHAELRFSVTTTGRVTPETVRIGPRSGIEVSPLRPAELRMSVIPPKAGLGLDESVPVAVKLINVGDRPARDVGITLTSSSRALKVGRPSFRALGDLRRQRTVRFTVRATQPRRFKLTISAGAANTNNPETELAVRVPRSDRADAGASPLVPMGLVVGLLGAVALFAVRSRRRRGDVA